MTGKPVPSIETARQLLRSGRNQEAQSLFLPIIRANPQNIEALIGLATALLQQKKFEQALPWLERARKIDALRIDPLFCLGWAYTGLSQFENAIGAYKSILAIDANHFESHYNVASCELTLGRHHLALRALMAAIKLRPNFAAAHNNLGIAYAGLNRHDQALAAFDEALRLKPDSPDTHRLRGISLLAKGALAEGWREYEARWANLALANGKFAKIPMWKGGEPFHGKGILLHPENGLIETVQCLRFVPQLAAMGVQCFVEVEPALRTLAQRSLPMAWVLRDGETVSGIHYRLSFPSIPHALGLPGERAIPAIVPYLLPNAARALALQERFRARPGRVVAIVWDDRGQTQPSSDRALPIAQVAALFKLPGVRFVSLQRSLTEEERTVLAQHDNVLSIGDELSDVDDMAAAIAGVDMVVAVDSVAAHVAGALGKPLCVMLPFAAHWRWMVERPDSPWYPTARLLRQATVGQWQPVLQEIARILVKPRGNRQ